MGHPTLRRVARPVTEQEAGSAELRALVKDMRETLPEVGGIGLAAPQVDVSIRLAIIEIPGGETRYGELAASPLTVYINPEIEVLDEAEQGFWEGCLSVPGLRGWVERPQHIRIRYRDLDWRLHERELQGFEATVFQHEFDHLDGVLYIDRIRDTRKLVFEDLLDQVAS